MRRSLISMCAVAAIVAVAAGAQIRPHMSGLTDQALVRRADDAARAWVVGPGRQVLGVARGESLTARSVNVDHGTVAVRFDSRIDGVRIWGGEVIVRVNAANGRIAGVEDQHRHAPGLTLRPTLSRADAIGLVWSAMAPAAAPSTDPGAELIVYPKGGVNHLAWLVDAFLESEYEDPQARIFVIDAHTGSILDAWDNLHSRGKPPKGGGGGTGTAAAGTGNTLYLGAVPVSTDLLSGTYDMTDLTRGKMYTTNMNNRQSGSGTLFTDADNVWGNGSNSDPASAGSDAHFGAEMTWDYYLSTFGRNGIYNDGTGPLSRVHYGRNYNNAFWSDSCRCMTYGDGDGRVLSPLVALDVAGHEMTHGVTAATANLAYSGESGGLNESMSDIFGTAVEFYAAAHGAHKTANYWIGEDIYTPGTPNDALRYMDHPTRDGASIDNYSQYTSSLDVHYSSGLANNVFYLMSEGGRNDTSGISVTKIGRDKAEAIFYRALTVYMTSTETFAKAKSDTVQAAQDLYGATTASAVAGAWSACGVN